MMTEDGRKSSDSLGATPGEQVVTSTTNTAADDEEEPYVHDQLPSVEEVRIQAASYLASADRANRVSRRRLRPPPSVIKWLFFLGLFLLIVAMIVLIVGLTTGSNNNDNVGLDRDDVETFLVMQGYASKEEMSDDLSPQSKAVDWLVHNDGDGSVAVPNADDFTTGYTEFLQRYALVVLFFTTAGENWNYTWNMLVPNRRTCEWNRGGTLNNGQVFQFGARCSGGIVTRIQIPQSNLAGPLPRELGYLSDLTFLGLHHNALTGGIPGEWQMLNKMDYMALHVNQLTGRIPGWVDDFKDLRVLGLGDNLFTGLLPEAMMRLTNLVTLGLDNNFFDGNFLFLQDMRRMERLYLNENNFGTTLGTTYLLAMRDLLELDLSSNKFRGSLPIDYFQFPKLRILDLGNNMLTGILPLGTYDNAALNYVTLDHNNFTGPIVERMANMVNLTHLDLSGNSLTGNIPSAVTSQLTNLRYLFLADNPLTPSAVPDLSALKHLEDVSLKGTSRTGEIPIYFPESNPNLVLLDLDNNALQGAVPRDLGGCPNLQYLLLNRNEGLTGQIPSEIQELPKLSKLPCVIMLPMKY
jgi:uncharacterized protein YjbI with pentapeptide repeats